MIRLFKKVFSILYLFIFAVTGAALLLITWDIMPVDMAVCFLGRLSADISFQAASSVIAIVFLITGFVVPVRISRSSRKKRVVAFKNPDGEVTISLSAIEEYVKKTAQGIAHIEDVRSQVDMNKRGINIRSKVTVASGANIPKITEEIQKQVKKRLQSMLGVEEKINVLMHVRKIGHDNEEADSESPQVPFREME